VLCQVLRVQIFVKMVCGAIQQRQRVCNRSSI
jgi:hypothetical protein